jgi:hypothetical protein
MDDSSLYYDESKRSFILKTGDREMQFSHSEWSLIRSAVDKDLNTRYENLKAYASMKESGK